MKNLGQPDEGVVGPFTVTARREEAPGGAETGARWTSGRLFAPARYDRLEGSLRIARAEVERRFEVNGPPAFVSSLTGEVQLAKSWKDAARSLLADARAMLERGRGDQAWKLLHASRRCEIFGMNESELTAFSISLRAEAEKVKPWRKEAIAKLLEFSDKLASSEGRVDEESATNARAAVIAEAALIRDEHYNNQGYKDQLIRTQLLFLALILAGVMACVMALSYGNLLPIGSEPVPTTFYTLVALMLFGNLGGTVSAILRATGTASSARIPEITSATRVTFMRILVGGASAVVVHLALQSQLTGVLSEQLANASTKMSPQTTYLVAFVAGFSERLVLRAVEAVAGKPASAEPDKTKKDAEA